MTKISRRELDRLRALAREQAEIAGSDSMKQLYADWARHGCFEKNARPMLTIELWTFADEIIPGMLQCETSRARELEALLLSNIIPYQLFGDDTPVRSYIPVPVQKQFVPFGLETRKECSGDSGYVGAGHRFLTYLEDLEEDWHLLSKSKYSIDMQGTRKEIDGINELIGDILPARRSGETLCANVAEDIIHMISMENLYVAMLDTPALVHRMVDMLVQDYDEYFTFLESYGLLPTASDEALPQGSYCFNGTLPAEGEKLKVHQVWGYMDAEEMNDVSPQMYRDFIVEHYKPLTARFGALSYGCCEAIHRFWKDSVETLPNLRKVSVSAWCDVRYMGEQLQHRDIVFLSKPTANLLGVSSRLDEQAVSSYFRETAEAAHGCRLEVTQRDVYLLHGNADKVRRYVELARAALERYWKP